MPKQTKMVCFLRVKLESLTLSPLKKTHTQTSISYDTAKPKKQALDIYTH